MGGISLRWTKAFSAGKVGGNIASHRGDSLDLHPGSLTFTVPVTYIYHEYQPNVGKYTIHGPYGL